MISSVSCSLHGIFMLSHLNSLHNTLLCFYLCKRKSFLLLMKHTLCKITLLIIKKCPGISVNNHSYEIIRLLSFLVHSIVFQQWSLANILDISSPAYSTYKAKTFSPLGTSTSYTSSVLQNTPSILYASLTIFLCRIIFVSNASFNGKISSFPFLFYDTRVKRWEIRRKLACRRIYQLGTRQKHE